MKEGQRKTREAYENLQLVSGYAELHGKNPVLHRQVDAFCQELQGKRVIDIGCGPGHYSYHFSKLGFQVVGFDYSYPMVSVAKKLEENTNDPEFIVGDMRDIGDMFVNDSFDGAWVSASMLHISEEKVPGVLQGIRNVVVNGGMVYVGLKEGKQGPEIIVEDKYDMKVERLFTFWEEENFRKVATDNGFVVEDVFQKRGGKTGGKTTTWLNFWMRVEK